MKYDMKRGEMLDILVENASVPVVLRLSAKRPRYHKMPMVKVYKDYTGFRSLIRSVKLISTETGADDTDLDTYEIEIEWGGGGDSSGCFVSATYPDTREVAQAKIYMLGP